MARHAIENSILKNLKKSRFENYAFEIQNWKN